MLDMEAGPSFVDALRAVWDSGDAAFPIDVRLPKTQKALLVAAAAPTKVIERDGERRNLEAGRPARDGDALVVCTSGSTGRPKAVLHTHDSIKASALATGEALGTDPVTDVWLACLPLAHIGGLSVITRAIHTGTGLVVHPRFDPAMATDAARSGATLVSLVTRALTKVEPALFRKILLGGGAPPPERPPNAVVTYGMTETGSGCVYDGWPIQGTELLIEPIDGDHGEIYVRTPGLGRAYRDATHEWPLCDPATELGRSGWFATGDGGQILSSGRLCVHGRLAEVINTGGEMVWPTEVERVLSAHPNVAEALVFARPDPEWGEAVIAAIEVPLGAPQPTLSELRSFVAERLAPWYAPKQIEIRKQLPRTALGKLKRPTE